MMIEWTSWVLEPRVVAVTERACDSEMSPRTLGEKVHWKKAVSRADKAVKSSFFVESMRKKTATV